MKSMQFLKPLLKKIDKYILGFEDFDEVETNKAVEKNKSEKDETAIKPIN